MEAPVDLGAVLGLRMPTGATGEFRGLGDWTVEPYLIAARDLGLHEVHATLGVAVTANDVARSRVLYGVGGSLQPWLGVAFFADVLGTSDVAEDEFDVVSANDAFVSSSFIDEFQQGSPQPIAGGFRTSNRMPRMDLVDLNVGVKWNPVASAFVFASVLVPLTPDGLRADAIPSVGAQWVF